MPSTVHVNPEALILMVERAARSAAQWMANVLVATLRANPHPQGHTRQLGMAVAKPGKIKFDYGSPVGTPPFMRTGKGVESVGWEVTVEGHTVKIKLGVDDTARPGFAYMWYHETEGYPGKRPWDETTILRYMAELQMVFNAGMRM